MRSHRFRAVTLTAVVAVAVGGSIYAWAQQPAAQSAQQEAQPAQPTPPRGRLPAYYGQVVNQQQREQIYAIQAKYSARIAELQKQLEELRAQRDAEIEKVLTPEQLKRIAELRARAAGGSGSAPAGGGAAPASGNPPAGGSAPPAGGAPRTSNPPSGSAAAPGK